MVKNRKRLISLFVVVMMLAALLIPMVGPASANVSYGMTNVKKIVNDDAVHGIGSLVLTFDAGSWNGRGQQARSHNEQLRLPDAAFQPHRLWVQ